MGVQAPDAPFTVRLCISEERRADVGLHYVQKRIIEDLFGMARETIFCVQCFPSTGVFDVTFWSKAEMQTCWLRQSEKAGDPTLEGISFCCSESKQRISVVVHMYNPFVRDEEIRLFLLRYCDFVSAGMKQTNVFGTFNGRRKFWVQQKPDADGIGGVRHPPQAFAIGSNRGYLWYPGQPTFCRQCFAFGHTKEECETGQVCRNCFKAGHRSAECGESRKCHFCGSGGHLARSCPKVPRENQPVPASEAPTGGVESAGGKASYADAVRGGSATKLPSDGVGPVPAEDLPGEPLDVAKEDMHSHAAECVPEVLVAEGEQGREARDAEAEEEGSNAGPSKLVSEEEEMDVSLASLKRKKDSALSPSQVIEEYSSGEEEEQGQELTDDPEDSDQSFASTGKVEELQSVMGYRKPLKNKRKAEAKMLGVKKEEHQRTRSGTRGRCRVKK